jgi:ADP-heptose:LPS heptosyltransferase
MILTTPLFRALRDTYPGAEIHVLASQRNFNILEGLDCVDTVHVYVKSPVDLVKLVADLRAMDFDLLIDPKDHSSKEGSLIARLVGAKESVGYNHPPKNLYTHSLPSAQENDAVIPPVHAIDRNLKALEVMGHSVVRHMPVVAIKDSAVAYTMKFVPEEKERPLRILLNISVGQPEREWPAEKWVELGKLLTQEYRRVVVMAAPPDRARAADIVAKIGSPARAFLARDIHDTVAIVHRGDILVSCDSAPVHIASALNIPLVGIFNSILWNSYKFHPLSSLHRIVQPEVNITELSRIPIVSVFQATKELIKEHLHSQRSVL